jgi:integrase
MEYAKYFELYSRLNGVKKIAVLRTECLSEFIQAVVQDPDIDREYKTFLLAALSGGLRVNEALALTKSSFVEQAGDLFVTVRVLKKRKEEERLVKIHPEAVATVRQWLSTVIGKPFKFSYRTTLRRIKDLVGLEEICNHSLRHSLISFLLFEKNLTHIKAAKLIHIGLDSMLHYSHLNERKVWKEIF